ncbi:MAG: RDD family protein [Terriglobales bacterium]
MSAAKLRWRTEEGFAFELPLAPLSARCLAWIVDAAVVAAGLQVLSLVIEALARRAAGVASGVNALVSFAVLLLYAAALEWWWQGQTVGKRALGLQVMDARGLPLSGAQVLMRNLLRVMDFMPLLYLVGGASCVLARRGQRVGDLVAGTVVVARRGASAPAAQAASGLAAGKYNSLREHPLLALRLREQVRPEAAALVVEALARREGLEAGARARIYGELAAYFRGLVEFPGAATAGLSPEQYLRNVVGVLAGTQN